MTPPRKRSQPGARRRRRAAAVPTVALDDAARYREFFENANDALALFTPAGTIALVNRAAEHLLGYTRAELLHLGCNQPAG